MSMKTDHIENRRKVGGDWFNLTYSRRSRIRLCDLLHNFNPNDYYILKTSRQQRLVSTEDFLSFRHLGYTFFKKSLYDKDKILEWLYWYINLGGVQFLVKPTPPFNPNKIVIRK